jgi:hypothetical protein
MADRKPIRKMALKNAEPLLNLPWFEYEKQEDIGRF